MAVKMLVLLLLGYALGGGGALTIGNGNSKLLAALNSTASSSLDLLLRINVLNLEAATTTTTAASPMDLESIIRAEINGDWERARLILQLAYEARTVQLKHAIYEALWLELQQTKLIYDPLQLLDFYEQLEQHEDVPQALMKQVYKAFVNRSAQLISAPFHTPNRSANFPVVDTLLQRLTLSTLDYLRDILEALFDIVLALESTLSVVQRLGSFNASLSQLSWANLQLLQRSELQLDVSAQAALQQNLRQLLVQPEYEEDVKYSLRQEVYAQLAPEERVLYSAQKVCLRNVTDDNAYIYECPQTYLICTNARDPKKAAYHVQRGIGGVNNSQQFAFNSSYWSNRYILMESNNQTAPNSILKSIYSREQIFWWHIVLVPGGGVALFDANSGLVLCGGDPSHWDGVEHHVYTRIPQDFPAYRNECTWSIEDCSDAVLK